MHWTIACSLRIEPYRKDCCNIVNLWTVTKSPSTTCSWSLSLSLPRISLLCLRIPNIHGQLKICFSFLSRHTVNTRRVQLEFYSYGWKRASCCSRHHIRDECEWDFIHEKHVQCLHKIIKWTANASTVLHFTSHREEDCARLSCKQRKVFYLAKLWERREERKLLDKRSTELFCDDWHWTRESNNIKKNPMRPWSWCLCREKRGTEKTCQYRCRCWMRWVWCGGKIEFIFTVAADLLLELLKRAEREILWVL